MLDVSAALSRFSRDEPPNLAFLAELCSIPSVNDDRADPEPKRRAAALLAERAGQAGFATELVESGGSPPFVLGELPGPPGAPILILYGHYDVVPVGRPEAWRSSPWDLTPRDGRLFARGAADDKGGCALGLAAARAWRDAAGGLPLTVRLLFEGEEESGSAGFAALVASRRPFFEADAALLLDGGNLEEGRPSIGCSTRGACLIEVSCESVETPVHSGIWGGTLPDPAMVLSSLLASLVDVDGRIAVPGFYDRVRCLPPAERTALAGMDDRRFLAKAGLAEGSSAWGEAGYSTFERAWTRPSIVTHVLEGRDVTHRAAAYMERATARMGLRTVPDMDTREAGEAIVRYLLSRPNRGARVKASVLAHAGWWRVDPDAPAVLAAARAMEAAYGCPAARVGDGGSIGVLGVLARETPALPCMVMGLQDPGSAIHAENKSLSLGEWRAMGASLVRLMGELAGMEPPAGR